MDYAMASGLPSNFEMNDYSDSSGSVDLATGDMSLSLPVLHIPGIDEGLSYDLSLSYGAGIPVNLQPSNVGLGWGLNIPTITRTVRGVPDDYQGLLPNVEIYDKETGTYYNKVLKEKKSWSSFWSSVGMTAFTLALTFTVPGGPVMTNGFMAKTAAISAVPFLRGPPTYKEYETVSKHFDIEAGTATTKGFFYLDEEVDDEYLLEVNNPDLFSVNSPIYSGGITYPKYSPFDVLSHSSLGGEICMIPTDAIGLNVDTSSNPNLFNSDNYCDNPLSIKFVLENDLFSKIELVDQTGLKYIFEPTVTVTFSHVKQTKVPEDDLTPNLSEVCEKLYSRKRDYDYIEVNLTEKYVSTWSLSRIESTRNSNDYIDFIY